MKIDVFPTEPSAINPECCDGTTVTEADSLSPAVRRCRAALRLLLLHLVFTAVTDGAKASHKNKAEKLDL